MQNTIEILVESEIWYLFSQKQKKKKKITQPEIFLERDS